MKVFHKLIIIILIVVLIILVSIFFIPRNIPETFDGESSFSYIEKQVNFGPRYTGSEGYNKIINLIQSELKDITDEIIIQELTDTYLEEEYQFKNIIARINPDSTEHLILGTHFDSRYQSELDPENPEGYMPGANDSASGTAVLLQLARELNKENLDIGIDFIFFDGEEGFPVQDLENWYPIGSKYFASHLNQLYNDNNNLSAIIIDMVGDQDLEVYIDRVSFSEAPKITKNLWRIAHKLYPDNYPSREKYAMRDDHTALLEAGVPATLVIDFDYPYFHTTQDNLENISANSLEKIGIILKTYIKEYGSR